MTGIYVPDMVFAPAKCGHAGGAGQIEQYKQYKQYDVPHTKL
ncbi:hypothetical protein BCEN4_350046 [Burkholderia cenocepacia]|nr:hypothetical protein BCEN4_350046 [Burkholderia cenocepacia]